MPGQLQPYDLCHLYVCALEPYNFFSGSLGKPSNSPHFTQKERPNVANQCMLCDPSTLGPCLQLFFPTLIFLQPHCLIIKLLGRPTVLCSCTFTPPVPLSGMLFPHMATWLFFPLLRVIASQKSFPGHPIWNLFPHASSLSFLFSMFCYFSLH